MSHQFLKPKYFKIILNLYHTEDAKGMQKLNTKIQKSNEIFFSNKLLNSQKLCVSISKKTLLSIS